MKFKIFILTEAEEDIFEIYRYISTNDSFSHAEYVFEKIKNVCQSLSELPKRGHVPPELEWIGVTIYREIHFKPYRIIYEINNNNVFIHCILDGRRDIQDLLVKRLLR